MPKQPRAVLDNIFAFSPNRETLGATAYLIVENNANILVDCPPWDESTEEFLTQQGGVQWLFLTHRGGISKVKDIQKATGCKVVIQEWEAYLLPELTVQTFEKDCTLSPDCQGIWTPGHSPGSSCLYYGGHGGVLFVGRLMLPNAQGEPMPLRTSKTFHWTRQIQSVKALQERFTPESLHYICPGASTGFLRGKRVIDSAYDHLAAIDVEGLRELEPVL